MDKITTSDDAKKTVLFLIQSFLLFLFWLPPTSFADEQCDTNTTAATVVHVVGGLQDPKRLAVGSTFCSIAISDIQEKIHSYQFIDVRSPSDFSSAHIQGAINIAPQQIKTKSFLKDKPLLLLDYELSYRRLEPLCRSLYEEGFSNVAIFTGGLRKAEEMGLRISGNIDDIQQSIVSPRLAMEEYYRGGVVFVVQDEVVQKALSLRNIPSEIVQNDLKISDLGSELLNVKYEARNKDGSQKAVVFIALDGADMLFNDSTIRGSVFGLQGGANSLIGFLDKTKAINKRRLNPLDEFYCPTT